MIEFKQEDRNRVRRHPERADYDSHVIYQIIDEAIVCHVAFAQGNQPIVIPTLHARMDDNILIHGASSSRLIRHAQAANELCLSMTLLDGLVLARSAMNHSINYRSVVLFGRGAIIDSAEEKLQALELFTNTLIPGRWNEIRPPSEKELKATSIVSIPIDLASAKMRQGPPGDDESDMLLDAWAGVVPIRQQVGTPVDDPRLKDGIKVPDHVHRYVRNQGR